MDAFLGFVVVFFALYGFYRFVVTYWSGIKMTIFFLVALVALLFVAGLMEAVPELGAAGAVVSAVTGAWRFARRHR